jgi:hypothetical protein
MLIAAILAMQVAAKNRQSASAPPIVEHQVIGGEMTEDSTTAREVDYILERAAQLGLTDGQRVSLQNLKAEWESKSGPLTDQMNRAALQFESFMSKAKGKSSMQDIQSRAAPVSELSRQVSSLRRIYWQKALQVLDADQRKALQPPS